MKQLIWLLLIYVSIAANAQSLAPTDEGSEVGFSIRNVGIATGGSFTGLKGVIVFDPAHLSSSMFQVTVDAKTIDTDLKARDNHLRKEEYFSVDKYPVLSFSSSSISIGKMPGQYIIHGTLSIKGTKKDISFPFTATPRNGGYLFSGNFKINRRDFNVGGRSMFISDNLSVTLSVLTKKI